MKCCGTKRTREDFRRQARIHRALANEGRLLIVDRLKDCECSVSELAEAVELDISTVSNHLSVLLGVGIVDRRRAGNTVWYRLVAPCVLELCDCTDRILGVVAPTPAMIDTRDPEETHGEPT